MEKTCNTSENSDVASCCKHGSAVAKQALTCLSCASHRRSGCLSGLSGWPTATLENCPLASYESGTDEREDWEQDHQTETEIDPTDQRKTNP